MDSVFADITSRTDVLRKLGSDDYSIDLLNKCYYYAQLEEQWQSLHLEGDVVTIHPRDFFPSSYAKLTFNQIKEWEGRLINVAKKYGYGNNSFVFSGDDHNKVRFYYTGDDLLTLKEPCDE